MIDTSELRRNAAGLEGLTRYCVEAGRRTTEDLVKLAAAAASVGRRIDFTGLETRSVAELIRIAVAGGRWRGRI